MDLIIPVLALSSSFVFFVLFLATAVSGLIHGKVYYDPTCAPVEFKSHPVRFTAVIVIHLAGVFVSIVGAVMATRMILDRL